MTETLGQSLATELQAEVTSTRKLITRIPLERFTWKPHEKSMPLLYLAVHIAEMIRWVYLAVTSKELDYSTRPYKQQLPENPEALLAYFDQCSQQAVQALLEATDETLHENWTVRNGTRIFFSKSRHHVIRRDCINHFIHHRGQLTVYLRLNDIPLSGVYGPTADEG
jgi:uncharacterized damage-inducible protein DinB